MKEKAYPVWAVTAQWEYKTPEGWKHNSTYFKTSQKEGIFDLQLWWNGYKNKGRESKLIKIERVLLGEFVWWMKWFCHVNLNYHDNEKDAFESFRVFLEGTYQNINILDVYDCSSMRKDTYLNKVNNREECLMGAEERWRWKFCGCEQCKKEQITIIKH